MPWIRFAKSYPPVEVQEGANLMRSLLEAGRPVASSCHGDGVCARCRIEILEGSENLSRQNDVEKILRERNRISRTQRISCQTEVHGDITVDASYW